MEKVKKILIAATVSFLLVTLLNSCHKYPDDPFISLKSPLKRLVGTWRFTSYQINGTEHSHDFDNILATNTLTNCIMVIDKIHVYSIYNGSNFVTAGHYYFIQNNKTLEFDDGKGLISFSEAVLKTSRASYGKWEIAELYTTALHLNYNGIDIYFTKQ